MLINIHVFDIWSEERPAIILPHVHHRYKTIRSHVDGQMVIQVNASINPPVGHVYEVILNGKKKFIPLFTVTKHKLIKSTRETGIPVYPTDLFTEQEKTVVFNDKEIDYSIIKTGDRVIGNPKREVTHIHKIEDLSYTKPFANVTCEQRDSWLKRGFTHILTFEEVKYANTRPEPTESKA